MLPKDLRPWFQACGVPSSATNHFRHESLAGWSFRDSPMPLLPEAHTTHVRRGVSNGHVPGGGTLAVPILAKLMPGRGSVPKK